ncbi:MAG: hypothetical protein SFY80_00360 [Verrucomicrobiota bacterium]|nr:hypothetical protein [Verrucomicrobiota bacterium]
MASYITAPKATFGPEGEPSSSACIGNPNQKYFKALKERTNPPRLPP